MVKLRVYELAKELGLQSKDLIEKIKGLNIDVGNHMSNLDEETVKKIKNALNGDVKIEDSKEQYNEKKSEDTEDKKDERILKIGESIQVRELAEKLDVMPSEIITKLMGLGLMITVNEEIDFDTASIISAEYEYSLEREISEVEDLEDDLEETYNYIDEDKDLQIRPPVITVMGHVDHGKTSLLDAIRETNVTNVEAGGITQHIGAYTVRANNKEIVFLDTPGHEAFTSMRARGAKITDIAILVVAADDGVKPQTIEAINHAKAADVPIVVAINKVDKPDANPDKVMQELTEYGLVSESWGGDTIFVQVSAKQRTGIEELLEMLLLVAEVQELKANPDRRAVGTVIEANLDKGRGPVSTVLIQKGTLKIGDSIITGQAFGRVRAMIDDKGNSIRKAGPSTPIEILGLSEVPESGDKMYMVEDDKKARQLSEKMRSKQRDRKMKDHKTVSLEDLFDKIEEGQIKDLNIIIKADVRGTIEAIRQSLIKLSTDEVRVNPIHGGVGAITESDVMLASASSAIIIGFNIRPTDTAMEVAKKEDVDVRTYRVIYAAIEDIKSAIDGMLEPEYKEVVQGRAEVREIFKIPGGVAAGIHVANGKITRNSNIRILRDNVVVYEGELSSLRRFKDDVSELATNYEGGLGIEGFTDMKDGDVVEAYIFEEIKR